MKVSVSYFSIAVLLCGFIYLGCSSNRSGVDISGDDATVNSDKDSETTDGENGNGDGNTLSTDVDTKPQGCAAVYESAILEKVSADIVVAVDNSGSMTAEAQMVQENLNEFLNQIINEDVDARITLISSNGDEKNGICLQDPLGIPGACPGSDDSNLPLYQHVIEKVSSHDALEMFIWTYPEWKDRIRPDGQIHFIVVSDDDSDWEVDKFLRELNRLEVPVNDFVFHSIVSSMSKRDAEDIGHPCAEYSAHEGTVYKELSANYSGVVGDLCTQEFKPIFDEIAKGVIQNSISCSWVIPPVPAGEEFDKNKVNIQFTDNTGQIYGIGYLVYYF